MAAEGRVRRSWRALLLLGSLLVLVAGTLGDQAGWRWAGSILSGNPSPSSLHEVDRIASTAGSQDALERSAQPSATPVAAATKPPEPTVDPLLALPVTPSEALDRMRRCMNSTSPELLNWREGQLDWLTPEAQAVERAAYAKARAWLDERCREWAMEPGKRALDLTKAFIERAQRSPQLADRLAGLFAQLQSADPPPGDIGLVRELLDDALRAGDPELLLGIGRVLGPSQIGEIRQLGIFAGSHLSSLAFALAGCELGAACGPNSPLVMHACALQGRCGYLDYPTLVYDASVGRDDAAVLRRVVDQIVHLVRSGQTAGMFDPPPVPPPPVPPG